MQINITGFMLYARNSMNYLSIKLLAELMKKLDADLKHEICRWAAHYVSKQSGNNFAVSRSTHLYQFSWVRNTRCALVQRPFFIWKEHKMRLGSKAIFHLEAFVAKFMSVYKEFLVATFG
ncbi:hypothetical protein PR202_gb10682 [Eleusine coracana subsp. coracana]|uniref:Uncharacterized protein n=1 Tax=Eleusine coracana subsp. coracana TaxID=191504 RepID=A0AAV5ELC4_ELECO|nr:hypothetical protein PR202_gb10682 [Eleusine coracana subsp. coracana]